MVMKCKEILAVMPDLAADLETAGPEMSEHLKSCAACRLKLEEFRQTMALLDQWQAPEPSPYFDVRLMARIREERAKPVGLLAWLRKPALAVSLGILMVMSVALFRSDAGFRHGVDSGPVASALPGTAVGDLQALDKNSDLYSDFELLDDLQVQQDVSANP
jgi:predicted anti-sigma-YlaC factor YlaD